MPKWEYMTIEVGLGWLVNNVNRKPVRYEQDVKYRLYEYLELIGKDGWEVVTSIDSAIIAKRPIE